MLLQSMLPPHCCLSVLFAIDKKKHLQENSSSSSNLGLQLLKTLETYL